ncbi:MAG: ATP-binding protein [Lachnospiraceae bacterium]|nr:ATP-binding protein [Lachnospiraceae bacterium]
MFTDIVNRRFCFKKVEISNESGVEVIDESGGNIDLQKLSSGEQETLVLFYQLLFEVPDQVLLLVDEPEISLHVAWQRMFIEDLRMIAERKCGKVIVATHSPQIVNGNREIQRDLGEMYKNGLNQGI